ncbi:hypothetical protein [Prosthecomicrobium sp. N25]|uniref:hypothetical protein n=1 Tax=Prosthecomicrobium sp. N25 TaxID=3129254 RepID=UPI0030778F9D
MKTTASGFAKVSDLVRLGIRQASLSCVRCGRRSVVALADYPRRTAFVKIKPKLACSTCGATGIDLDLMPDWTACQPPSPRATRRGTRPA